MSNCTNCNAEVSSEARVCEACGADLTAAVAAPPPGRPHQASQSQPHPAQWSQASQPQPGQYQFTGGTAAVAPNEPQAVLALVLGIVSVAFCGPVGIPAIIIGNKSMKNVDASGGAYSGRGMAQAGMICGWVGVGLFALMILFFIIFFASFASFGTSGF